MKVHTPQEKKTRNPKNGLKLEVWKMMLLFVLGWLSASMFAFGNYLCHLQTCQKENRCLTFHLLLRSDLKGGSNLSYWAFETQRLLFWKKIWKNSAVIKPCFQGQVELRNLGRAVPPAREMQNFMQNIMTIATFPSFGDQACPSHGIFHPSDGGTRPLSAQWDQTCVPPSLLPNHQPPSRVGWLMRKHEETSLRWYNKRDCFKTTKQTHPTHESLIPCSIHQSSSSTLHPCLRSWDHHGCPNSRDRLQPVLRPWPKYRPREGELTKWQQNSKKTTVETYQPLFPSGQKTLQAGPLENPTAATLLPKNPKKDTMNQGTQVCWASASSGRIFGHGWPLSPHNRPTRSWPIIGIQFATRLPFHLWYSLVSTIVHQNIRVDFWIMNRTLGAIKGEDVHSLEATQKISRVYQYIKIELNMNRDSKYGFAIPCLKITVEAPKKSIGCFPAYITPFQISMRNSFENHDWVPTLPHLMTTSLWSPAFEITV